MAPQGQPEIAQPRVEILIDQEIGRLYIPVDHRRRTRMEGVDRLRRLHGEPDPPAPIGRPGARVQRVVQRPVAHQLHHQEPLLSVTSSVTVIGAFGSEAEQVHQSWAVELGEDFDLVVGLGVGVGGFLDGDVAAVGEDGLVDEAVAALAQELLVGEAVGGGLEVGVVEVLELDWRWVWGLFLFFLVGFGFGGGIGHRDC